MNSMHLVIFAFSGVAIYLSVLLPRIALKQNMISHPLASVLSGLGVGFGAGLSVFWGASNGDIIGSSLTGAIVGMLAGLILYFWWK
jgi:hypothetical protein